MTMADDNQLDVDSLARSCDLLRKALAKGSTNMILVPEVRDRLHQIIEAADTLLRKHPDDVPEYVAKR